MAERALATAFVNIVPGTKDMEAYLKSGLAGQGASAGTGLAAGMSNGFGSKIKSSLMPVLGSLGIAFGAMGIANFTRDMYSSAMAGQKADAVLSNITGSMHLFGKGTDAVITRLQDYATAEMKLTGIDDDLIKGAQSKLMTFSAVAKSAGTMGGAFDRATGLAMDLSAAGFGSLDSASVTLGKALQDPVKGVTALQRVGVSLSEAQKKQVAAFMKVNNVAGAQKIILDEVARQVGGTAEASATAGEKMKARWDDAVQSLGTTLMPVFDGIISFISTTFVPAMEGASGSVKGFLGWFGDNQAWLLPTLAGIGAVLLGIAVNTAAMGIAAAVAAAGGMPAIIAATWAWTAALLANPVTWIILGIGLLIAAVVALAMNWDKVTAWVKTVWAGFMGWINDSLKNISSWWNKTWAGVTGFLRDSWNNISKAVSDGVTNVTTWFKQLPAKILGMVSDAGKWLFDTGKNIIEGLINGLKNAAGAVGKWIADTGKAWIDQFKSLFGIHSPSRVFHEFGKNILEGLKDGLMSDEAGVTNTFKRVMDWVDNALWNKDISAKGAAAATALVNVYSAKLGDLAKKHDVVVAKLKKAQDDLAKQLQAKADMITSISEKFGGSLAIDDKTTAKSAVQQLKDRITKAKELKVVTDQLVQMGINKDLYRQIVEAGAVDFAKSIVEGGSEAVKQLNVLADEASTAANDLAKQVGAVLFDEGIAFAQSVVDGLLSEETVISTMMNRVADEFATKVAAIVSAGIAQMQAQQALVDAQAAAKKAAADLASAKKGSTAAKKATTALATANNAVANAKKSLAGITIPALANGGVVNKPTVSLIGEAGPEIVTPLKDFQAMTANNNSGPSITYVAAPNQSLDAEQALFQAIKRAKVVGAW